MLRFRGAEVTPLPEIHIGDMRLRELTWLSDAEHSPAASAAALASDVAAWLDEVRLKRSVALDLVA